MVEQLGPACGPRSRPDFRLLRRKGPATWARRNENPQGKVQSLTTPRWAKSTVRCSTTGQ